MNRTRQASANAAIRSRNARAILALSIASILVGNSASAATYQWDTNGNASGLGGPGAWDTSTPNWDLVGTGADDGTDTPTIYTFTSADTAIFGGTAGTATLSGGVTINGLTFNTDGYQITGGTLTLAGSTPTITTTTGVTATINSAIAGSNGLTKTGTGTLVLSGANTYTGGTNVNTGTLSIGFGADTSLHAIAGGYNVATGAVLNMDFGTQADAVRNTIAGNVVVNGTLNLASKSGGNDGSVLQGSTSGFGISGAGVINKNDTGRFEFGGWAPAANALSLASFSGTLNVNAGTLGMNYQGAPTFGSTSMTLNIASGATFDMRAGSMQVDKLTGSGTYTDSAIVGTLTVGANGGSSIFGGIISSGLLLTKAGAGTLTLSGAGKTYTGATTINAGTLRLSNVGTTFASAIAVNGGTTLELNSTSAANTFDVMYFNGGAITGTGTITKTGIGVAQYNNTTVLANFAGTIDIQAGTFGSANTVGTLGKDGSLMTVNVGASGLLDLRVSGANAAKIDKLTGTGKIGNTYTGAGSTPTLTVGTANGSSQFDGSIQGAGGSAVNDSGNPNAGTLILAKVGTGTFTLTGANTYAGGTTISGGTLQVGTGGTLGSGAVTNNAALVFNRNDGSTIANAIAGTSGSVSSIGTGNLTLSGIISGSNSVSQSGTGILTLSGASTYTGATSATAGRLNVTGTLSSNVSVGTGATLSGSGTTSGTLTLDSGSTVIGGAIGASFQAASIGTTASINILGTDGTTTVGSHTMGVLRYSSGAGPTTADFNTANYRTTGPTNIGASGGEMQLTYTNAAKTWTPTSDITWVAGATGPDNWSAAAGDNKYYDGDLVTFDGVSGGAVTLNTSVTPGSVTFNNSTLSVSGTGGIAGATALTKSGTGTVTLNTNNTYTGNTTISGGTLQIAGAGRLGGGAYAGTIANAGTFQYSSSANQTLSGTFNGAGSLLQDGTGKLTLSGGAINYTGATNISAGTLKLSNVGNTFNSSIAVGANGILELNSTNTAVDSMMPGGSNSAIQITGTGTINKTGAGWVEGTKDTFKNFNGTININEGIFGSGFANGLIGTTGSSMAVNVAKGAWFDLRGAGANAAMIDKLTGTGFVGTTHTVNSTLTVGTAGGSSTFDGIIKGAGGGAATTTLDAALVSLTKVGTGTFTLTNANTYAGTTTINGGSLIVNGSLANTAVTVNSGATLGGSGTITGSVTGQSGSFVAPGTSAGKLSTGAFALNAGATLSMELGGTGANAYDQVNVTGTVTLGGTLSLALINSYAPQGGDQLWLALNDGSDLVSTVFSNVAITDVGTKSGTFTMAGVDWTLYYGADFGTNSTTGGNDILLTAVPEPGSVAALAGGLALLLGVQRRRRSA